MFPNRQCDTPAARPVAIFARFTVAEVAAGLIPLASRMLALDGPNPIPRAPSTMAAKKPARPTRRSSLIIRISYRNTVDMYASGSGRVPSGPSQSLYDGDPGVRCRAAGLPRCRRGATLR